MSKKYFQYHKIVDHFLEGSVSAQDDSARSDTISLASKDERIKAAFIRVLEEEGLRIETANATID